ncbi:hypothetical protein F8S09_09315 [Deinococcus sp. SDU3-2]|uniref:Uncharacterized protein n=1 Tax=Deinococcus terrestris TaxID=2651870 RepID=A0A7X1NW40_9DEIO|nr:hypothetical protein [Deinococcus terrestris]MPY66886.1 hypothetical protein [Deinococcus terrestris]
MVEVGELDALSPRPGRRAVGPGAVAGAAAWGGVGAALASVWSSVTLLDPEVNRDANIGMGFYWVLGWLFPLGPAFGIGMALGLLAGRRHGLPPSPAALEDARPLPALAPWLWPLLPPAAVSLAVTALPFMRVADQGDVGSWAGLLIAVLVSSAGQLAVTLSPALIALLVLRGRAARDGAVRSRLAAFWGLCLGLAVTLRLFGFGQFALVPRLPLEAYILLHAAPPLIGYGVGWWVGRRQAEG